MSATSSSQPQAETSRVFIRGLPPAITDNEFQTHFSKRAPVTDIKLFPSRRIGYIGYRTAKEAQDAIDHFNKSYVRTSQIFVEAAVRPGSHGSGNGKNKDAVKGSHGTRVSDRDGKTNPLKRKREGSRAVGKSSESEKHEEEDPKLKEWLGLMMHPSRAKMLGEQGDQAISSKRDKQSKTGNSRRVRNKDEDAHQQNETNKKPTEWHAADIIQVRQENERRQKSREDQPDQYEQPQDVYATDTDWMRSRTSRLLGLLDDNEELAQSESQRDHKKPDSEQEESRDSLQQPTPPPEGISAEAESSTKQQGAGQDADKASITHSGRLFIRNLSYTATETDIEEKFTTFGHLEEVHVATDAKTGMSKGLAFVQFKNGEDAANAYSALDGQAFQGRLLHILPAEKKRESKLDEFAISQMPLKKQKQIQKRTQALTSTFNWNSLYMNTDAVMTSIADRLGVAKSEVFDPSSSDAAVKQAQAETHVIQETKAYFEENGVDISIFKRRERDDCAILVKNFSYGVRAEELKKLFSEFGEITKVLMPPSGTIAIVQFGVKAQAQAAFKALAYRKYKDSVLFLEKAPKGVLDKAQEKDRQHDMSQGSSVGRPSASDIMQSDQNTESLDTSTLFIRDLNFATTNERLLEAFKPLDGLRSVRIKTKPDPKTKGQTLSMGFGFAEFDTKEHASSALIAMNGYSLDGHRLVVKASHKGADAADERRREDRAKRLRERKSKIIIKNLPFEATNKDVRNLFRTYGQLRAVRVPKKLDNSRRGFGFAEFTTPKEAESALTALQSTHLLGRRLVLDYAAGEPDDPEEELKKMQEKISKQSSRIALQNLSSSQRRKFEVGNNGVDDEGAA